MPVEIISNVYLNFGLIGLVIVSLAVLIVWVIKTSKEREDKLQRIIETLSENISTELPTLRKSVERIETKLFH